MCVLGGVGTTFKVRTLHTETSPQLCFCFCFGDRLLGLLCGPGWSWTHNPFDMASHDQKLQLHATVLGLFFTICMILTLVYILHCQQLHRQTFPKLIIIENTSWCMIAEVYIPWQGRIVGILLYFLFSLEIYICAVNSPILPLRLHFSKRTWVLESYLVLRVWSMEHSLESGGIDIISD